MIIHKGDTDPVYEISPMYRESLFTGEATLVEMHLTLHDAADLLGCELGSPQVAQNQDSYREHNPPYQILRVLS